MTIRHRLALLFTGLVAVILLSLSLYVFYLSQRYTDREFIGRLEDRALLAGQYFLETEEMSPRAAARTRQQFLQALPDEVTRIYDSQGKEMFEHEAGSYEFPPALIEQLRRDHSLETTDKKRVIVGTRYLDNDKEFLILASAIDMYGSSKLRNLREVLFAGFWIGILVVYFVGRYFAKKSLEPVSRIVRQVQRIKASNLHLRLNEGTGKDELAELARTFNSMLARLQASFDSQRTFVRNASHELRTPLAVLIGETEVALNRERSPQEYRETIETVLRQSRQLTEMVNDLLSLSNSEVGTQMQQEEVRIDELLLDIQAEMKRAYPKSDLFIDLNKLPQNPNLITVMGSRSYLKQAFGNIVQNALKYSDGKAVQVRLFPVENQVQVEVQDQGIGIPEAELKQVFQPFYRGTNALHKDGHGIGLALAKNLFLQHSGTLEMLSEPGKGTTAIISLPSLAMETEAGEGLGNS